MNFWNVTPGRRYLKALSIIISRFKEFGPQQREFVFHVYYIENTKVYIWSRLLVQGGSHPWSNVVYLPHILLTDKLISGFVCFCNALCILRACQNHIKTSFRRLVQLRSLYTRLLGTAVEVTLWMWSHSLSDRRNSNYVKLEKFSSIIPCSVIHSDTTMLRSDFNGKARVWKQEHTSVPSILHEN